MYYYYITNSYITIITRFIQNAIISLRKSKEKAAMLAKWPNYSYFIK